MKKKIWKFTIWIVLVIVFGVTSWLCEKTDLCSISILSSFFGALSIFFFEKALKAYQDFLDNTDWKSSQRKLKRGGYIKDNEIIRISFAYLYRIKVGNKYLLVQNSRNTGKYQPVGGVYKIQGNEKLELKKLYHIMDDDKIQLDESSRNDYRLRMENRYLRKFMRRFNSKNTERERIENVSREFKEELVETGVLDWKDITYRYCGRHITELKYSDHFQLYEMLLADVVELIPTKEQEDDLKILEKCKCDKICFATAKQITQLGVDFDGGKLYEWIGDHTIKILQENESKLIKMPETGKTFKVYL